jgi:hypothetical protein
MCQLTLSNLNDPKLNKYYMYCQLMVNSTTNKDGYGIYTSGKMFKSSKAFEQDENRIENTKTLFTKYPAIGHVRIATSYNGKRIIDDKSSHPFETEKIILSHNGTLEIKDVTELTKYPDVTVDSQLFTIKLTEMYVDCTFYEALKKTMDLFTGRFAFLIYDKVEHKYYVVRGNASLHISFIKINGTNCGFVVNTEVGALNSGLRNFVNLVTLISNNKVEFTTPVELDKETVFEVNSDTLVGIGELKENAKVYVYDNTKFKNAAYYDDDDYWGRNWRRGGAWDKEEEKHKELFEKLADICIKYSLSIVELDSLSFYIFGMGLAYLTSIEAKQLLDLFDKCLNGFFTKKKQEIWKELLLGTTCIALYNDYNLQLPYFINGEDKLKLALKALYKEIEVEKVEEKIEK